MYLLSTLLYMFALSFLFFNTPSGTNGVVQTGNCTTLDGIACNITNGTSAGGLCAPGWQGPDCDEPCNDGHFGQNCSGECFCVDGYPCDVINGSCPDDVCAPGWQGDTCGLVCGFGTFGANCSGKCYCGSGTCDPVNGNCTGGICAAGWQGETCNTACGFGTFGANCNGVCYCGSGTCDLVNGNCSDGICAAGWQGETCSTACGNGSFGANCSEICYCGSGTCDPVNGNCTGGICAAGWQGEMCNTACRFGTFGANCNGVCYCGSGTCDPVGGNCTGGICAAGWQGETCSTACDSGTFGHNCNGTCHCQEDSCNVTTGQCPDNACGPGWQGPICQQPCDSGLYGEECTHTCNCWQNEDCDHVTGMCSSGCLPYWAGEACQYQIPPAPKDVIVRNVTETAATLEWTHSDTEPYGYIVQYRFYPYRADDQWQNSTIIHGALTTYTIHSLQPATEYMYNIMAVSDDQITSQIPGISELIHRRFTTTGATPPPSGGTGLSSGAVVGVVIACLLGVAGIAAVYFFRRYQFKRAGDGTEDGTVIFRKNVRRKNDEEEVSPSSSHIYDTDDLEDYKPEATLPRRAPKSASQPRAPQPATPQRALQPPSQNRAPPPRTSQTRPQFAVKPIDHAASELTYEYTVFGMGEEARYWEIPKDHLQVYEDKMLGKGHFGQVYKGELKKRGQIYKVAVKKSKESQGSVNDFLKELLVVSQVAHVGQHENIVKFMGAITAKQHVESTFLVYEFADEGELRKWLKDENNIPVTYRTVQNIHTIIYSNNRTPLQTLLHFGIDVCKGMIHLAEAKVNHRDLAARNVLLFSKGNDITAKVTDFGLAEDLYKEEEKSGIVEGAYDITNETLPVKWSAPEILMYGKFNAKSDVWSFGILLWEIFSFGGNPYSGIKNKSLSNYLMQGNRLSSPPICPVEMYEIMQSCWEMTPEKRPGFDELLNEMLKVEGLISHKVGEQINSAYEMDDEEDDHGYLEVH